MAPGIHSQRSDRPSYYFDTASTKHLHLPLNASQTRTSDCFPSSPNTRRTLVSKAMCKKHTLVFWSSPPSGTPATYESRLRPQSGTRLVSDHSQATDAFVFYKLCSNSVLAIRPTCPVPRIVDAGIVEDKIQPFCQVDDECTARLYEFQTRFENLLRRQQADERGGAASQVTLEEQRLHTIELRQAWRDWVSVYENHAGCFERRNAHPMWRRLIGARVVPPMGEQPERLGVYPHVYDEPQVGFERGFQMFETRGLGSGPSR